MKNLTCAECGRIIGLQHDVSIILCGCGHTFAFWPASVPITLWSGIVTKIQHYGMSSAWCGCWKQTPNKRQFWRMNGGTWRRNRLGGFR